MKQEQVIELAKKAKCYECHGLPSNWDDGDWIASPEQLERLVSLVEQATLERAADHVETYLVELCAGDKDMQKHYLRSKSTREFYAGAIRNLAKESQ